MDNMDIPGDDITHYDNVANYSDCNERCKGEKECSVWTYIEGTCWLKSENTFRAIIPNVVGGIKDCEGKGRQTSFTKLCGVFWYD